MFKVEVTKPGDMFRQLAQSQTFAKEIRQALAATAREALGDVRAALTSGGRSGREYSGRQQRFRGRKASRQLGGLISNKQSFQIGKYRASAPGEAPANVTGTLAAALKAGIGKKSDGTRAYVIVRSRSGFYGRFLEKGGKNLAKRPFLQPVENKYEAIFEARAQAVLENARKRING